MQNLILHMISKWKCNAIAFKNSGWQEAS